VEKKIEKNENMKKSKKVNNTRIKVEKEDPLDTIVRYILGRSFIKAQWEATCA